MASFIAPQVFILHHVGRRDIFILRHTLKYPRNPAWHGSADFWEVYQEMKPGLLLQMKLWPPNLMICKMSHLIHV